MLLLEITIMLLVFSICAAVCLSVFCSARSTAEEADKLTGAAMWAQSAAEAFKASGGDLELTARILGGRYGSSTVTMGFDENWQSEGDEYMLTLTDDGGEAEILILDGEKLLFSMKVRAVSFE
ncbi:MAG: hypothetical protein ACI3VB_03010 [Oscillospiraceae bacterium]